MDSCLANQFHRTDQLLMNRQHARCVTRWVWRRLRPPLHLPQKFFNTMKPTPPAQTDLTAIFVTSQYSVTIVMNTLYSTALTKYNTAHALLRVQPLAQGSQRVIEGDLSCLGAWTWAGSAPAGLQFHQTGDRLHLQLQSMYSTTLYLTIAEFFRAPKEHLLHKWSTLVLSQRNEKLS